LDTPRDTNKSEQETPEGASKPKVNFRLTAKLNPRTPAKSKAVHHQRVRKKRPMTQKSHQTSPWDWKLQRGTLLSALKSQKSWKKRKEEKEAKIHFSKHCY